MLTPFRSRHWPTPLLLCSLALAGACGDSVTIDPNNVIVSVGRHYAGKHVKLLGPILEPESTVMKESWAAFEQATGITIDYEGTDTFEADVFDRVSGANAPDIVLLPSPGLMTDLARANKVVAHPELGAVVDANYVSGWRALGSVNGKLYGMPFGANVKSLVWYSPAKLAAKGYTIPTTWTELLALSEKIVTDGGKPWCVGMQSGDATGWVGTDWIEDLLLRTAGADTYDKWITHQIPFNAPAVVSAFDEAAKILKNDAYIAGGVASIVSTTFFDSPLGLLDGSCYLHRQASFIEIAFPETTTFGPSGDIDAFYFPGTTAADRPVLGGGELLVAVKDLPEVKAALLYLASDAYANTRAPKGGWISPHKLLNVSSIPSPVLAKAAATLKNATVFRFDGSDLMPAEVGAGTFWSGVVDWIGGASTATVTAAIEASWPAP